MGRAFKFKKNFSKAPFVKSKRPKREKKEKEIELINIQNQERIIQINKRLNEINFNYPDIINQRFVEKKLTYNELQYKHFLYRIILENNNNGRWFKSDDDKYNNFIGYTNFSIIKNEAISLTEEKNLLNLNINTIIST